MSINEEDRERQFDQVVDTKLQKDAVSRSRSHNGALVAYSIELRKGGIRGCTSGESFEFSFAIESCTNN
jgi:hypothetical protein